MLRQLFEANKKIREEMVAGVKYPTKLTVHLARHALEYGLDQFKKLGVGPLRKLVPEIIARFPAGGIIEVKQGADSVDFFYHNGTGWFDASGKKLTPEKITAQLRELNSPEDPKEFSAMGWVPKA
jgi:hypothetical protein